MLNLLVSAAFLLVCSALPGFANIITLDENGHGTDDGLPLLFDPNGTNPVVPFQRPVLIYTLPFAGVPGQVELIGPESGVLEDVLQFTGNGTVIFYSKRDSDNSLADRFSPPMFPVPVTNTVVLTEAGSPGNDGAFYTPSNGQPGFDVSRPTYHFISNSQPQITKFQHVIVIVQENRTPDNLFQGLCVAPFGSAKSCSTKPDPSQYDIQTRHWVDKNTSSGKTEPKHIALAAQYDLDHSHAAFLAMCDADPVTGACKMDGAGDVVCSKRICPSKPQFRFVDNSAAKRTKECITDDDYEVYVDKNILKPLEMYQSYFDQAPYHLLPYRSHSYFLEKGKISEAPFNFDTGITVSNGGLNAPFLDMQKYLQFLLGNPQDHRYEVILKRSTLEEMFEKQLDVSSSDSSQLTGAHGADSIGLAFFRHEQGGRLYIGHGGNQNGFLSHFYLELPSRSAYLVAYNTDANDNARNTSRLDLEIREYVMERGLTVQK